MSFSFRELLDTANTWKDIAKEKRMKGRSNPAKSIPMPDTTPTHGSH